MKVDSALSCAHCGGPPEDILPGVLARCGRCRNPLCLPCATKDYREANADCVRAMFPEVT